MSNNMNTKQLANAAIAKYVAQREEAKAMNFAYVTSGTAVPEHSNIVGEIAEWTKKLSEAEGCIQTLNRAFSAPLPPTEKETNGDAG